MAAGHALRDPSFRETVMAIDFNSEGRADKIISFAQRRAEIEEARAAGEARPYEASRQANPLFARVIELAKVREAAQADSR